jgi:lysine/ornithine N-monooxygenase
MHRLPKEIHDKLHSLAVEAYERELQPVLNALSQQCFAWNEKHITNAEFSSAVHDLHQGQLREIFRFYKGLDSDVLVARAFAMGLIKKDEIPSTIFELIQPKIELFKEAE